MPELPDVTVYVESIRERIRGQTLERIRFASPFLLRSAVPPIAEAYGRRALDVRRLGKRIVFVLDDDYFLVLHLMVAGRLKWAKKGAGVPGRIGLCAFDWDDGVFAKLNRTALDAAFCDKDTKDRIRKLLEQSDV